MISNERSLKEVLTVHHGALAAALQTFPGSMVTQSNLASLDLFAHEAPFDEPLKDDTEYHRKPVAYFKPKEAHRESMQEAFIRALEENRAEPFFALLKFLPESKKEEYREIYRQWLKKKGK